MGIVRTNGLAIPEHLSVDFFRRTLEEGLKLSYVEIEGIVFSMASAGGDNFTSIIYRVRVQYSTGAEQQVVSLIVKCIPVDGDREVFKIIDVYGKEVLMYKTILPAIERLLESSDCGQIAPRLIYSQEDPVNTIVFQDLKDLDLVLGNRTHGLDEEHAKLVMTKLGQFHGASMVLARDQPELMHKFNSGMFDKKGDCVMRDNIFRQNIGDMADLVQMWHGFEEIARKLRKIKDNFYERVDVHLHGNAAFKVLNHGDVWVNNCMFKHVSGIPADLLFIDFQMSYYGSPAFDIHYFLHTSVQLNVLISKRYHLLRAYYKSLKSTLERLRYEEIPTWEELKNEIREKEFIGFWAFEAMLPLLSLDKAASNDTSVEDFQNETGARRKRQEMFSSDRFLSTIQYSLDRFDEMGVLD